MKINMQSEHVRAEDSRESAVRVPVRLRVSFDIGVGDMAIILLRPERDVI